jgi:hypothetical protein
MFQLGVDMEKVGANDKKRNNTKKKKWSVFTKVRQKASVVRMIQNRRQYRPGYNDFNVKK